MTSPSFRLASISLSQVSLTLLPLLGRDVLGAILGFSVARMDYGLSTGHECAHEFDHSQSLTFNA